MRKLLRNLLILGFVLASGLVLAKPTQAQSVQSFTITSFNADYHLTRDAQNVPHLAVTEQIEAVFPSYDQNHGIERALPASYKDQPIDLTIKSVTDQSGKAYHYTTRDSNGNKVLRIGDADTYVHGNKTYVINYSLKNPITFFDDHDEFYWNVNGTQWSQPFDKVTAHLYLPNDLSAALLEGQLCYTGVYGSTAHDCTTERNQVNNETVISATAYDLSSGQNLSLVTAFKPNTFAVDKAAMQAKRIRQMLFVGLAVGLPLVTLVVMRRKWRKQGRDPDGKGTIIPEYVPPKNLNSLTSDVIVHEALRNQAISAIIVELAIRKVILLRSTETKKLLGLGTKTEYEIEMLQPATGLTNEEASIHSMIFGGSATVGTKVQLKDLSKKAYTTVQKLAKSVPTDLFTAGYFSNDPVKITKKYLGWGSAFLMVGFFSSFALAKVSIILLGACIGLAISGVIVLITAKRMPARSAKGVATRDYLYGLREFIKVAEAERLKYLQSPKGVKQWGDPKKPETKVKLFEKLLPYAMIFGLEKEWAKEFEDIYKQPPDWYQGNWNTFNTIYLVNSLNSFSTASMASFAPPSSSSSSGFGGGGFSGGGGGGGGGGGW